MPTNAYMIFVAALIPLVVGAIYYHPKVVGTAWMRANNLTLEQLGGRNMAVVFGMVYVLSVMLSFLFISIVLHQGSVFSLLMPEVLEAGTKEQALFNEFIADYGDRHRSFTHGMAHGLFSSLLFAFPIIAINAIFERKSWRYVLIHVGYWTLTLVLMGGILCATMGYGPILT